MSRRRSRAPRAAGVALVAAIAVAAVVLASLRDRPPSRPPIPVALAAPVAGGDSAGNITLNGSGTRVLVRWVARSSGVLSALHLRIQANGSRCRMDGQDEYGRGDGGTWQVSTFAVRVDGRPDGAKPLTSSHFRPCDGPAGVVDVRQGVVRIAMRVPVEQGAEYATVIRNEDPDPSLNYTSVNFLFEERGLVGANGRNERDPHAPDAYYGLDPRELVGYSTNGGRTWLLPGGPYGIAGGRNFLPTYLQEYADGQTTGQPYYYTTQPASTPRTMLFPHVRRPWTIRALGAYAAARSSGTLALAINGRRIATIHVRGLGMLRAAISPVTVRPGQTASVTARGVTLRNVVADTAWGRLAGMHLPTAPWRIPGERDFSEAAPVYPLPGPPAPQQPTAGP